MLHTNDAIKQALVTTTVVLFTMPAAFATSGDNIDHNTVLEIAADLKAHGGDPAEVQHVGMDMSAACRWTDPLHTMVYLISPQAGRGRDGDCSPPPAQIRTCGTTA